MGARARREISPSELDALYDEAVKETIARFEETGSPVVSDGEQRKPSFATDPIAELETLAPDGVVIPFADGHTRQLPRLTAGPFLPSLFRLQVGNVDVQLASEPDPERVLGIIAEHMRPGQVVFAGVTDPIDPRVESPEEVCARV
jgi:methionine synthase II (cobalamin-independent)